MLFLIESDNYSAHITAHGFKREDFASKFREEALRALSGMCPRVFTVDEAENKKLGKTSIYVCKNCICKNPR